MTTPSDADLTAIIDAATPGEWSVKRYGRSDNNWIGAGEYDDVIAPANVECMAYCYGGSSQIELSDADATFIATFNPQMVASLLARAQAAEQALADLTASNPASGTEAHTHPVNGSEVPFCAAEAKLRAVEALADSLTEQGDHHVPGCMGQADCAACVQHDLRAAIGGGSDG